MKIVINKWYTWDPRLSENGWLLLYHSHRFALYVSNQHRISMVSLWDESNINSGPISSKDR